MDVIWVRHGETAGNALRQYIGRTDLPLNDAGREQILQLRERLRSELASVTHVYHSPYQRTRETMSLLLGTDIQSPTTYSDPRLAELDFGDWEAKSYADLEALDRDHLWRWYDDPWRVAPPNGETLHDLDTRLASWHEEVVLAATLPDTLLVVTHGGPLRWWYALHVLQDPARFPTLHLPPGGYVHVRHTAEGWELVQGEITSP